MERQKIVTALMDYKLYIKHKLTAYHFRRDREGDTTIAICSCGWKCRIFRDGPKDFIRELKCIRGHDWKEPETVVVGSVHEKDGEWVSAIDEGEEEGVVLGSYKQCARCYKCKDV